MVYDLKYKCSRCGAMTTEKFREKDSVNILCRKCAGFPPLADGTDSGR